MKKKLIKNILGAIFLIFIILGTYNIYKIITKKKIVNDKILKIPELSFLQLQGTNINYQAERIIIYYFSPDCDHCQYMTKQLVQNCESLKKVKLLMVTAANIKKTKTFINDFEVSKCNKDISIYIDTAFEFHQKFGASSVPSFFIYKNGKLDKKILGETKLENLLQ